MSAFSEQENEASGGASFVSGEFGEMTPERLLAFIYGGTTFLGVFLYFVFLKLIFLLLPMLAGGLQLLCAFMGICPLKKFVRSFFKKEEE